MDSSRDGIPGINLEDIMDSTDHPIYDDAWGDDDLSGQEDLPMESIEMLREREDQVGLEEDEFFD